MIMPSNGTESACRQADDLLKHRNVELRGLEPLASCMPSMANPSGIVRDGQVRAGQSAVVVWDGLETAGMGWTRSHLIRHWLRADCQSDPRASSGHASPSVADIATHHRGGPAHNALSTRV
jgi:hypothetical protein